MQTLNTFESANQARMIKLAMNEHPYGDPFSGAPYGQFEKSKGLGMVLGVVASVVSMGAALPMLASASLATQLAGGAMMASGVLNGVGTVTGNKKLMKIGGVLSLAGGIGAGLSSMTGGLGMGAGSTGVQNMAGSMMESINGLGVNVFNPELVSAATSAGQTAGTVGLAGDTAGLAANVVGGNSAPLGGEMAAQAAGGAGTNTTTLAGIEAASGTKPGLIPQAQAGAANVVGGNSAPLGNSVISTPPPPVKESGMLDKALGFMRENPELTKIGGDMVKGFAESAMGTDKEAEMKALIDKYKADTRLINTQADYAAYTAANAKAQVAMISADDPQLDAKVQDAKAKGIPVAFIPTIGAKFDASQPKAWGAGTTSAGTTNAQTPVRQGTFAPQGA